MIKTWDFYHVLLNDFYQKVSISNDEKIEKLEMGKGVVSIA